MDILKMSIDGREIAEVRGQIAEVESSAASVPLQSDL
jgi:hypothetical protein